MHVLTEAINDTIFEKAKRLSFEVQYANKKP
jgi:hypothetical protein